MKRKKLKACFILIVGSVLLSQPVYSQQSPVYVNDSNGGAVGVKQADDQLFTTASINKNTTYSEFGGYMVGQSLFYCSAERQSGVVFRLDDHKSPLYNLVTTTGQQTVWNAKRIIETKNRVHLGPICGIGASGEVFVTVDYETTKSQSGERKLKICKAKLDASGMLTDLEELPFNSPEFSTGHPSLSADGKTLFFASDRPGGLGGVDIYKISIGEGGMYGTPQNLGNSINTSGNEMFPFTSENGMLFFSSNGHGGFGGLDVLVAYPTKAGWNQLTNLGKSLNSESDDFAFIMANDQKSGYFSSDRSGGKGSDDVYAFVMQGTLEVSVKAEGIVFEKGSKAPLSGVTVNLLSETGELIESTLTDNEGKYNFSVEPDVAYQLTATMDKYYNTRETFSTTGLQPGERRQQNLELEKDAGLSLYGVLADKQSKTPVSEVTVRIVDNITGKELGVISTDEKGNFNLPIIDKHIGDRISYNLELSKEGYMKSVQTINSQIDNEGVINLSEKADLSMVKIDKGSDLGKLIDLKPIYFDYAKFVITPTAAIELDKIVKIMNDNPNMVIELGSHTDARGSAAANLKLSDKRAKASAEYIKKRITNPARISGKGFGESKLLNKCADGVTCSDVLHAENRRTEFVIIKF